MEKYLTKDEINFLKDKDKIGELRMKLSLITEPEGEERDEKARSIISEYRTFAQENMPKKENIPQKSRSWFTKKEIVKPLVILNRLLDTDPKNPIRLDLGKKSTAQAEINIKSDEERLQEEKEAQELREQQAKERESLKKELDDRELEKKSLEASQRNIVASFSFAKDINSDDQTKLQAIIQQLNDLLNHPDLNLVDEDHYQHANIVRISTYNTSDDNIVKVDTSNMYVSPYVPINIQNE